VNDIIIRRLGWAGHIRRMEMKGSQKKVLNEKFYNLKPVGKPRTRWLSGGTHHSS
jgi:hypothetical protein